MRVRLWVLCAGIAAHSQMPGILAVSAGFTAGALLAVWLLAVYQSALIRRPDLCVQWRFVRHGLCLMLLFMAGFLWAMLMAQRQLAHQLPRYLEGEDFWLVGQIEGLVRVSGMADRPSQQFDLRVNYSCFKLLPAQCESAEQHSVLAGSRVTLNDYAHLPLQSGQRWLLRVRVNRPHGFSNPGGYDFEAGQFQRGVMARGYVRDTPLNTQLPPAVGPFSGFRSSLNISRLRAVLASDIASLADINNPGLLNALVVGDREGLSSSQWQLFTATGTNHLVVISGLHVGFVALCVWLLVNWASRLFPRLLLYMPAQHLAGVAAILAAAGYSLLAGFSLSTQRALIMIVVLMASRISGRRVAPADSLSVAALLVLLRDPMAVTQAGFWLSFVAVASLFFAFTGYGRFYASQPPSWLSRSWQRWVQPQWVVSVGLLLPLLLWTGQMSLNAPLANVFAIPLVSLLVVPLALVGGLLLVFDAAAIHELAVWLLHRADDLLDSLQVFLTALQRWTPGLWRAPVPSMFTMVLMVLSSMVLLMPKGLMPRWLALPLLLPLIWPPPPERPPPGRARVQFLDVGQGLAVVVHTHRHHLMFDTGPALGPDFDAGRAAILPYLYQAHVSRLHTLIISHWHADHSGGLSSVLADMDVDRLLAGPQPGRTGPDARAGQTFQSCQAGQHWRWDEVSFTVLFPPAGAIPDKLNNSSCVLLIEAGGQRVLLTGDIEESAERWLLANARNQLQADVLQAPHHGSRSSSSAAFVQAVSARWVIMSAGYRNRFDHPHQDIVERYQQQGADPLLTADSGAILLEIGGEQPVLLSRHRQQQRRFWFNL